MACEHVRVGSSEQCTQAEAITTMLIVQIRPAVSYFTSMSSSSPAISVCSDNTPAVAPQAVGAREKPAVRVRGLQVAGAKREQRAERATGEGRLRPGGGELGELAVRR
jgi:hypothetical protein